MLDILSLCNFFYLTFVMLDEFFESNPSDFYQRGIENLVEHREEVVYNIGRYIIDQLVVIFIKQFRNIRCIKMARLSC